MRIGTTGSRWPRPAAPPRPRGNSAKRSASIRMTSSRDTRSTHLPAAVTDAACDMLGRSMSKPRVVVVMPAYNAERTLEKTWRVVIAHDIVDLVIVVDDAS